MLVTGTDLVRVIPSRDRSVWGGGGGDCSGGGGGVTLQMCSARTKQTKMISTAPTKPVVPSGTRAYLVLCIGGHRWTGRGHTYAAPGPGTVPPRRTTPRGTMCYDHNRNFPLQLHCNQRKGFLRSLRPGLLGQVTRPVSKGGGEAGAPSTWMERYKVTDWSSMHGLH